MPDVCKVPAPPAPPIPTPFPNTAQVSNATKTAPKVQIENKDAVVLTSEVPNSMGDQAGSAGGVVSGMVGSKVCFRKGSSKAFAEGKPMVPLSATSAHNGANANMPAGVFCVPSQAKVLLLG
jgi:hypothetical protein